ncbi:hydrogenase small subunit [bacterium]|nr:hydrogenase small subunit [bacterium]
MGEQTHEMTRRSFLNAIGVGGTALAGASVLGLPGFNKLFAQAIAEVPVLWVHAGSCTGCSVSALNSLSPTIQDLLLGEVIPGKHVSLAFHPTVMAGQGHDVIQVLQDYKKKDPGSFVLVVEGALSTKDHGVYCEVGEIKGKPITMMQHVRELAPKAMAVVNIGTCSSYGGIPGAPPNPTGIMPVSDFLKQEGIKTPVVNVPGCPPHPDWFVGTIATVLIGGLEALAVDQHGRPLAFFGGLIHDNCPFRGQFDKGMFAQHLGEKKCLYKLGCKGPATSADCPHRRWNSGTNWCIGSGSPCIGCVEPDFPYENSMYDLVHIHEATPPDNYPPIVSQQGNGIAVTTTGALGVAVGAVAGAGIAASRAKKNGSPAPAAGKEGNDGDTSA